MARPEKKVPPREPEEEIKKRIEEERIAEKLSEEEQREIVKRAVGKGSQKPQPEDRAQ